MVQPRGWISPHPGCPSPGSTAAVPPAQSGFPGRELLGDPEHIPAAPPTGLKTPSFQHFSPKNQKLAEQEGVLSAEKLLTGGW